MFPLSTRDSGASEGWTEKEDIDAKDSLKSSKAWASGRHVEVR